MSRRGRWLAASLLLAFAGWSSAAWGICRISASDLSFGIYNPLSTASTQSVGNVTVSCFLEIGTAVIELGTGGSGIYGRRRMLSGNNALLYNLYTDSARTRIFGNGANGTARISFSISVFGDNRIPIYGAIPARQDVAPGTYTDTIIATVRY